MYAHKKLYIISAEILIYEENENMKEIHVLYQKLPLSIIQINRSLKEIADALCKPIEIFRSINTAFLKGQDKYIYLVLIHAIIIVSLICLLNGINNVS